MKLAPILLLLASCSTYQGKSYVYTTRVKILGVKCAQNYFFNYELGRCTVLQREAPTDEVSSSEAATRVYTPSGVSVDYVHTYKAAPRRSVKLLAPRRRALKVKAIPKADQCREMLNKGEL